MRTGKCLILCLGMIAWVPAHGAPPGVKPDAQSVVDALAPAMAALQRKDYPAAEKGLRLALSLEEQVDGPNSPEVGQVAGILGNVIENQGRQREAEPFYRRALVVLPSDAPEVAIYTEALANNLNGQGRHGEAEALFRALVARHRAAGPDDVVALASTLDSLGYTLTELGRARQAEGLLREAVALTMRTSGEASEAVARAETDLGGAIDEQGRAIEAEAHFRHALDIRRALDHDSGNGVGIAFNNVGSVLDEQGRIDEAEPFYRRALEAWEAAANPHPQQIAIGYANLGEVRLQRLDYAGAEVMLRKALALDRSALGPDHLDTAAREIQLAAALRDQGKFAEATGLVAHGLAMREKALGPMHPATGAAYTALAQLRLAQNDVPGAIGLFRRALGVWRKALGDNHPKVAAAWSNLADAERLSPQTMADALIDARRGVAIARAVRARRGAGREGSRSAATRSLTGALARNALREDAAEPGYSVLIDSAWDNARTDIPNAAVLRAEAFAAAQDMQRSAASEAVALAAARSLASAGDQAELTRREQDLLTEARSIDARLLQGFLGDDVSAGALRNRLDAIGTALAQNEHDLARKFPAYARFTNPGALSLAGAQARLGPDQALVFIAPSNYDTYIFAVTAHSSDWIKVPDNARMVVTAVGRLRCQADPVTCRRGDLDQHDPTPFEQRGNRDYDRAAAYALYHDLIAPIEPALGGRKHLLVVASGPIADLPLGMLLTAPPPPGDGADPAILRDAPWLSDRYAITTLPGVPALRVAGLPERRAPDGVPFIGFGAPALLGKSGALVAAMRAGKAVFREFDSDGTPLANVDFLRSLEPLPGTKVELGAMAGALKAPDGALHLGVAATETAVRTDPTMSRASVIAFATHGALPREADGFDQPGLVMTPPDAPTASDDGFLSASEAAGLKLSADWVVLSACNTASSEGTGGADSLSALASAFLYAGAKALLASHWRVEDDVTAALTVEILRTWRTHPALTRAEAMQMALRAVRTGKRGDGTAVEGWSDTWTHPGSWAPFSLIAAGD